MLLKLFIDTWSGIAVRIFLNFSSFISWGSCPSFLIDNKNLVLVCAVTIYIYFHEFSSYLLPSFIDIFKEQFGILAPLHPTRNAYC